MKHPIELDAKKHSLLLYDSATGASIPTLRALDVTAGCTGLKPGETALFLYGRAVRGRIVKFRIENSKSGGGIETHFFLDENPEKIETFPEWARRLGLRIDELSELMRKLSCA